MSSGILVASLCAWLMFSVGEAHEYPSSTVPAPGPIPSSTAAPDKSNEFVIGMTQCPQGFIDIMLGILNDFRADHGSPALIYSNEVAEYSQQWAAYLDGPENNNPFALKHQPDNKYGGDIVYTNVVGENEVPVCYKDVLARFNLIVSESNYSYFGKEPEKSIFNTDADLLSDDHPGAEVDYTLDVARILWYRSTEVGFGCALEAVPSQAGMFRDVVVINFNPPGALECQFRQNVLPQKDTELFKILTENGIENVSPDPNCECNCTVSATSPAPTTITTTLAPTTTTPAPTTFTFTPSTSPTTTCNCVCPPDSRKVTPGAKSPWSG